MDDRSFDSHDHPARDIAFPYVLFQHGLAREHEVKAIARIASIVVSHSCCIAALYVHAIMHMDDRVVFNEIPRRAVQIDSVTSLGEGFLAISRIRPFDATAANLIIVRIPQINAAALRNDPKAFQAIAIALNENGRLLGVLIKIANDKVLQDDSIGKYRNDGFLAVIRYRCFPLGSNRDLFGNDRRSDVGLSLIEEERFSLRRRID
ncbi:hypothetical protein J2Z47_001277 [Cohnella thailandensis]|nr:hypothetical protein [Cohnella thailandensis]